MLIMTAVYLCKRFKLIEKMRSMGIIGKPKLA